MDTSWKKLLTFSLPITFIGIAEMLTTLIDMLWVRYFIKDSTALAAIRVSFSYTMLIEAIVVGFASAMLIYISQNFSSGNKNGANDALRTTVGVIIIFGLISGAIGLLLLGFLGDMFGATDTTINYAQNYLRPLLFGFFFIIMNNFLLILPRYFEKIKVVYYALAILIVTNIIVTPLLMYFFEKANYSLIIAAGFGTLISNLFSLLYLSWLLFFKDYLDLNINKNYLIPNMSFKLMKRNFSFIFSQVFNSLTFSISTFLYMIILSYYPEEAFNVFAVASYIFMLGGVFVQNFSFSLLPLVSRLKGEGELTEIKKIVRNMVKVVVVYSIAVVGILYILRDNISEFMAQTETAYYFVRFIEIYSIPWILGNISMIYIFLYSGSGDAKASMYLIISNMYAIVILSLLFLPNMYDDLVIGVFFALAIVQILTLINSYALYLTGRWKRNHIIESEEVT
ncbi:MATE family efflux transporter [Alkalibacillus salilacus]|uniref:Na+-driven multidrug efflux pump n=1 Tax=Alkalibacillus salilacus TaxID=284582 RepID=A0ABT9VIX3_9BACI|nr:MATE family efflux transporter [Alkalibacillus salilacus]MDQ0160917.1 Na+-driven multidrug efflux pump [Alkalibacillus salilacus]